jgi:hypothetical protein
LRMSDLHRLLARATDNAEGVEWDILCLALQLARFRSAKGAATPCYDWADAVNRWQGGKAVAGSGAGADAGSGAGDDGDRAGDEDRVVVDFDDLEDLRVKKARDGYAAHVRARALDPPAPMYEMGKNPLKRKG